MSARARHLSVVLAVLLAIAAPLAVAAATTPSASGYRIKSGDTITSIAVQLRLPGGWEQLYSANRDRIGPDPNRLTVGTELTVPQGVAIPVGEGYVVRPGDTLDSIAARLHVAGGGAALFNANRNAIGSDPNRLEVGQTLLPPGAVVPKTTASAPAAAPASAPPASALNRPAAAAPVAQARGGATTASGSGNGSPVLWSALAALVLLLLVVLVLIGLPRWRRSRGGQEVWVGGDYSRDHQPAPETKPGLPKLSRPKATTDPATGSVVAAFRPGSVGRSSRPEPQRTVEPVTPPLESEGVRILSPDAVPSRPAARRPSAERGSAAVRQPVPQRDLPVRPLPHRAAPQPAGYQPDLTDELLGEVRLVDPSTPLTKERRQAS